MDRIKDAVGSVVVLVAVIIQFIAYWSVYEKSGFFSGETFAEIGMMTIFPPYAWWTAAKYLGVF